jgi:quercetin dioxygenase-like cupin family protein
MSQHEQRIPRRVVTGHSPDGVSVVVSDEPVPVHRYMPQDGVGFYEIWQTDEMPAAIAPVEADEPTARTLRVPPGPHGTKIRINEFFPGHINERGHQSPVHRTESIDYGIVLSGEIVLSLDDSEVTLREGDVVVQRGTDHAWTNRSEEPARVAFILVDGRFTDELRALLPADLHASVMRGGPHGQPDSPGAAPS